MLANDITLNTRVYVLNSTRPNSSIRRVSGEPVSEPTLLTVSHEINSKSGRVSSAVISDDTKNVVSGTVTVPDTTRVLIKLQYNPSIGRASLDADIRAQIADIVTFLGSAANVDKLLNLEH